MENHLLSFEEWDTVNNLKEDVISTNLLGKSKWVYKGEKYRKHWYEILPKHRNKVGFDVIFTDDTEKGTYRVDVVPQVKIAHFNLLGQDASWLIPAVTEIMNDFKDKNNVDASQLNLFVQGAEMSGKIRDAFTKVTDKISNFAKSVKLDGLGISFKL